MLYSHKDKIIVIFIMPVIFFSPFTGVLIRPVALALPYLLLLLLIPFVPVATIKTIKRQTGYYFSAAIALTVLILLLQIAFQVVLVALGEEFLQQCEFLETLFRHIGMIKFNRMQ